MKVRNGIMKVRNRMFRSVLGSFGLSAELSGFIRRSVRRQREVRLSFFLEFMLVEGGCATGATAFASNHPYSCLCVKDARSYYQCCISFYIFFRRLIAVLS